MRAWPWRTIPLAVGFITACGTDPAPSHPPQVPDEQIYDCAHVPDPSVTTLATDESFFALANAEAAKGLTRDDARAPLLLAPAANTSLSLRTPPTFTWQTSTAQGGPEVRPASSGRSSRWARLLRALSPIGVAHAHCGAVTGDNFLFRVEASGQILYNAHLSVTTFTPDAAKWSKALRGHAGKPVNVTLVRAYFAQGSVIEGPFLGAPVPFTLSP